MKASTRTVVRRASNGNLSGKEIPAERWSEISGLRNPDRADHQASADEKERRERMEPATRDHPVTAGEVGPDVAVPIGEGEQNHHHEARRNRRAFEVANL